MDVVCQGSVNASRTYLFFEIHLQFMSTATATLPRSFNVPCGGATSTVCVNDMEQLRSLRTEMELLRHVKRICDAQSLTPRLDEALHFSEPKQLELLNILADAMNPLVEETVATIDQDFASLRKEIVMSVVNDEAKNIVHEAQEIGVAAVKQPATATEPSSASASIDIPVESVEQALEAAQQRLSTISGTVDELAKLDSQILDEVVSQMPVGGTEASDDPIAAMTAATEELATVLAVDLPPVTSPESPTSSAATETVAPECETVVVDTHESSIATDCVTPMPTAKQNDVHGSTMSSQSHHREKTSVICPPAQHMSTHSNSFGVFAGSQGRNTAPPSNMSSQVYEISSERAEHAVETIEEGIRKLTAIMQSEVREQWNIARSAMIDIVASRNASQQTLRDAQSLLSEIRRFHHEAAGARDATDVDRREAGLFREDARRAKERAEASAAAAELSADQASKERDSIRRGR